MSLLSSDIVMYRIRVFDHGLFIREATVRNRGQRFITLTVQPKTLGLFGEEVKLAFMINPKIPPKVMQGGKVLEVDFDIRDATQMGDILDMFPDLFYEIDQQFKKNDKSKVIEAEYQTVSPDLLDDPAKKTEEKKEEPPKTALSGTKAEEIVKKGKTSLELVQLYRILTNTQEYDPDLKKKLEKVLEFCAANPKAYYFLRDRYEQLTKPISAVVWQSCIFQCGVQSSYYMAQSNAPIAEKIFTRPKSADDWKQTLIVVIGLLGAFGLIVALIYIVITHM